MYIYGHTLVSMPSSPTLSLSLSLSPSLPLSLAQTSLLLIKPICCKLNLCAAQLPLGRKQEGRGRGNKSAAASKMQIHSATRRPQQQLLQQTHKLRQQAPEAMPVQSPHQVLPDK
jgi:hypothetical protein